MVTDVVVPPAFSDGVTVADVTRDDGVVAPAIWTGPPGRVELLKEALSWALVELEFERPYKQVRSMVRSIADLMMFYANNGRPSLDEGGLQPIIHEYFLARRRGNLDLGWAPLSLERLKAEMRNIVAFSDHCQREYGYLPLLERRVVQSPSAHKDQKSFWQLMASNESDFFSHLAVRREKLEIDIRLPRGRGSKGGARGFGGMTQAFAWDLIGAEKNTTYKAIWLLGFFGGPRLSETLNLWVCDILPGDYRRKLFPGDVFLDLPLAVIADPWSSHWIGRLGEERVTREQFLDSQYGLKPRPIMAETACGVYRGKSAGFKGIRQTNATGAMRQLFWASEEAARLFESEVVAVMRNRARMPLSSKHPFLFVNTDPRKSEIQGNMLSMSNVQKAFERAVKRIGGTPYRYKQSPHGMRHFYKDEIKRLVQGDESSVQVCLGQRSRLSQHDYGSLDMRAMRNAMAGS